jgi:hypothetical protein
MSARDRFTIVDAIRDERLFGGAFKSGLGTWSAWLAFLAALFGLKLDQEQTAIWRQCTGREALPSKAFSEAWLVCGRRSGKSFMMALIGVFLACFRDYRPFLGPGEKATVMVVAADRRQARVVLRFVRGLLSAPVLARRIVSDTSDSVELEGDVVLEVTTASHSVRGYSVAAALVDEVAFFAADDASVSGAAVIEAIRPAMSTIPNSLLVCASSPYARRGPLWESFKRYYGVDDPNVLVWRAPTLTMNPSVPKRIIDEAVEADPASASAEYFAEFRTDVESFVTREAVEACVSLGVRERQPLADVDYAAFCDPSGGSSDSMTLAIGHKEGDAIIVDAIRDRKPPFSPDDVCAEFAALLQSYRVTKISGDKYAGLWPTERFAAHDVTYEAAAEPKSALYQSMLPLLNARRLDLLDDRKLVAQLCGLERRTSRAGKDSIDHAPQSHDDLINSVAGVASVLQSASSYWGPNGDLAWVSDGTEVDPPGPPLNPPVISSCLEACHGGAEAIAR